MKGHEAIALKDTLLNYFADYGLDETMPVVVDAIRAHSNLIVALTALEPSEIERGELRMLGEQIYLYAEAIEQLWRSPSITEVQ